MKRWSALQREICKLIDENLNLQIHLSKYRMDTRYGTTDLPRYWITLDGEIIFDYPAQFVVKNAEGNGVRNLTGEVLQYPYETDISAISALIRAYIDTPKNAVFSAHFESDHWGLINILKAADRRFGKRRLEMLRKRTDNKAAQKIISRRLHAALPQGQISE